MTLELDQRCYCGAFKNEPHQHCCGVAPGWYIRDPGVAVIQWLLLAITKRSGKLAPKP